MRRRMSVARLGLGLCLAGVGVAGVGLAKVGVAGVGVAKAEEQEKVYLRKDRSGRVVYTNIGNVSQGGIELAAMELRELQRLDLSAASGSTLRELDRRIAMAHDATRTSSECAQIRAASQDSVTDLIWKQERTEALACASLTGLTMALGLLGSGSLVSLLRLGTLVGSLSAGYDAASDAFTRHEDLAAGQRACVSDLPASDPADTGAVRQRLSTAADFQRSVQGLFDGREGSIDAAAREALR